MNLPFEFNQKNIYKRMGNEDCVLVAKQHFLLSATNQIFCCNREYQRRLQNPVKHR